MKPSFDTTILINKNIQLNIIKNIVDLDQIIKYLSIYLENRLPDLELGK